MALRNVVTKEKVLRDGKPEAAGVAFAVLAASVWFSSGCAGTLTTTGLVVEAPRTRAISYGQIWVVHEPHRPDFSIGLHLANGLRRENPRTFLMDSGRYEQYRGRNQVPGDTAIIFLNTRFKRSSQFHTYSVPHTHCFSTGMGGQSCATTFFTNSYISYRLTGILYFRLVDSTSGRTLAGQQLSESDKRLHARPSVEGVTRKLFLKLARLLLPHVRKVDLELFESGPRGVERANALAERGEWLEACKAYERVIAHGMHDASDAQKALLYHNLAQAYRFVQRGALLSYMKKADEAISEAIRLDRKDQYTKVRQAIWSRIAELTESDWYFSRDARTR